MKNKNSKKVELIKFRQFGVANRENAKIFRFNFLDIPCC